MEQNGHSIETRNQEHWWYCDPHQSVWGIDPWQLIHTQTAPERLRPSLSPI